ncbi:hypothetical protein M9Y10_025375 [Tritrichomonas musculus]|uniref:Protein kinase domain-containing protein n=1 Tax=Tritrichomonas musculus TaxID=1915356 RepID=A0ABR2HAB3_9EUKA
MERSLNQKYSIDLSNYSIIQKIDSGGFGSVYSVQNKATNQEYAAKIIKTNKRDAHTKKMINREIAIMMRVKHPAIVSFYGYSLTDFKGKNNVTFIMTLAKNGSLLDLLQKVQKGLLDTLYDNTMRQKILIGIARGMMYLHQKHIIHRDLKPGNIILDENYNPLITDFGLAKYSDPGKPGNQTQSCGTSVYMAPEVITSTNYNEKADVYSFAIIMYEVITDSIPFPLYQEGKMTPFQFTSKVVHDNYRPNFTVPIKDSLQNLIEKCWSNDPKERPNFEEIFNKLAFNVEESINDILGDDEHSYYLEDVDIEEILSYVDEIMENENDKKVPTDILIQQLMQEIKDIKSECNTKITNLQKENKQLEIEIQQNTEAIENLTQENNLMKQRLAKLEAEQAKKVEHKEVTEPKKTDVGEKSLLFLYQVDHPFEGIINHLKNQSKGNIQLLMDVTASSCGLTSGFMPINATDFCSNANCFISGNLPNSWLCYDFKEHKVTLKNYTLKSFKGVKGSDHPRSWVIEGSNDNDLFAILAEEKNSSSLNGSNRVETFPINCQKTGEFRYIRIRLTGPTWGGHNILVIDSFEIFGKFI